MAIISNNLTSSNLSPLQLKNKRGESFTLESEFIEWFTGFTDGQGNFNVSLKGYTDNSFRHVQVTFQIALHKDDRKVLEFIRDKIHCGSISDSGDRLNFFVNDILSVQNIIIPIFEHFGLRSSKIHSFNLFKKVSLLISEKNHLSLEGKETIINYRKILINLFEYPKPSSPTFITKIWLIGFIEGEASLSTANLAPRLKFENSIVEENLFKLIQTSLGLNNKIQYPKLRDRGFNEKNTVVLEYTKIEYLYCVILPLFDVTFSSGHTKKKLDFLDWSLIVKLNFHGYHLIPEGASLIKLLKSRMNNFRLTTNTLYKGSLKISQKDIDLVYSLPRPYDIYDSLRTKSGTYDLISRPKITVKDSNGNTYKFNSVSLLSKELKLDKKEVIKALLFNNSLNGYQFFPDILN